MEKAARRVGSNALVRGRACACATSPGQACVLRGRRGTLASLASSSAAPARLSMSFPTRTLRVGPGRTGAAESEATAVEMPESWENPPKGHKVYETMVIYSPDVQDSERDADIESFQSFLTDNGALDIQVSSDGIPSRMAYPIEGYNVGVYVLFMYAAPTSCSKQVQRKLSAPSIEREKFILRFMTTIT